MRPDSPELTLRGAPLGLQLGRLVDGLAVLARGAGARIAVHLQQGVGDVLVAEAHAREAERRVDVILEYIGERLLVPAAQDGGLVVRDDVRFGLGVRRELLLSLPRL
jgi:hypothetical protein